MSHLNCCSQERPVPVNLRTRFSLLDMFEFMTICSVICALMPVIGWGSGALLMLTTLAIAGGQGGLALLALGSAVILAPLTDSSVASPPVTMAVAAAQGLWLGRRQRSRSEGNHPVRRKAA